MKTILEPQISVLIITYKQEELVKRAIDSILCQKDFIYEICISDDCSPDGTWDVLRRYSELYPNLFKIRRNEKNLGIFQNLEKSWDLPTGNLVYILAGDDACPQGWFQKIINYINDNKIEYLNQSICFYGDYKCIYPNGDYFIKKNKKVGENVDLVNLTMRCSIGNRSTCFSRDIMSKFFKVSKGRSYVAEWAQEIQLPLFTDKAYYIPYVGNVYYTRIGVNVSFDKEILAQRVDCFPYMKECAESIGYQFDKKNKNYIEYQRLRYGQLYNWKFTIFLLVQIYFFMSIDWKDDFFGMFHRMIKRNAFALLRRLPHKQPLIMQL